MEHTILEKRGKGKIVIAETKNSDPHRLLSLSISIYMREKTEKERKN